MSQDFRIVPTLYDKNGKPYCAALNSRDTNKVRAKCILPPNKVIPVIFVPGIMGSNLASDHDSAVEGKAWAPDITKWALKFRKYSGAERKVLIDPAITRVDFSVPVDDDTLLKLTGTSRKDVGNNWKNEFIRRGWGTVMQGSYGELLCYLEYHLNRMYKGGKVSPHWQTLLQEQGRDWGEMQGFQKLVAGELTDAADYWYPVHAVGYNWLRSNREAGKYLTIRMRRFIAHYKKMGYHCDKAILVTHSMGGLVARAAVHPDIGGAGDDVLGIVHGVQPITGAAAAYKRVRAGNEATMNPVGAITAQILGWSGAEVAPVFAQSPGPLELLPTKAYPKGWLQAYRSQGGARSQKAFALPKADPYSEIYRERHQWWRLMDPALIDPAGVMTKKGSDPWNFYLTKLAEAEAFHDDLGDHFHPGSWVHYGADPKHRAWGQVHWRANGELPVVSDQELRDARLLNDDRNGRLSVKVSDERKPGSHPFFWRYTIAPADSDGDATVPQESGRAAEGKVKFIARMRGFDHQGSYSNEHVQSLTLYCIAKIAQDAVS